MRNQDDAQTILRSRLREHYERGLETGFAPFRSPEIESTALNSSPYVASEEELWSDFGFSIKREGLLRSLQKGLGGLSAIGLTAPCLLIGGSFADRSCESPNDLDVVILYRSENCGVVDTGILAAVERALLADRIDARFIPSDGSQLLLLKAFGYFCLLFSKRGYDSREISRGLLLIQRE